MRSANHQPAYYAYDGKFPFVNDYNFNNSEHSRVLSYLFMTVAVETGARRDPYARRWHYSDLMTTATNDGRLRPESGSLTQRNRPAGVVAGAVAVLTGPVLNAMA
jgi:hypothetical protein